MKPYLALLMLFIAGPALAHSGYNHGSFNTGLLHPFTGFDHLLMLSGAGILAVLGNYPKIFLFSTQLAMAAGALGGHLLGAFSGIEWLIALSLAVAGTLIFAAVKGKSAWAIPLLVVVHGWAHGAEGNVDGFWMFTVGFLLSSCALLMAGYGAGLLLRSHPHVRKIAGSICLSAAAAIIAG